MELYWFIVRIKRSYTVQVCLFSPGSKVASQNMRKREDDGDSLTRAQGDIECQECQHANVSLYRYFLNAYNWTVYAEITHFV